MLDLEKAVLKFWQTHDIRKPKVVNGNDRVFVNSCLMEALTELQNQIESEYKNKDIKTTHEGWVDPNEK